jgi:Ca2+-binding RTX toxin-like protein
MFVIGGAGNDVVSAGALTSPNSLDITAGAGNDSFTTGAGNDQFRFAANALNGSDLIAAGAGVDDIFITTGGDIAENALTQVTGIERIYLSNAGNSLLVANGAVATANDKQLFVVGGAGNDLIVASAVSANNRVFLRGGGGNDEIEGGKGRDTLLGEAGNDTIRFDTADQLIDGGDGVDTLVSAMGGYFDLNATNQALASGDLTVRNFENITITGTIIGTMLGTSGANRFVGGDGDDKIDGRGGADILNGGGGDDSITYDAQAIAITGGANPTGSNGDRLVITSAATVNLANAADQVVGGGTTTGFESVDASQSTEAVTLRGSNTPVTPGYSAGYLIGGSAGDTIQAGSVSTAMRGGGGADILKGGAGDDTFIYYAGQFVAGETVDGAGGIDTLDVYDTMSFLGDSITNVEKIRAFAGATVTMSVALAERLTTVGGYPANGTSETFIIQMTSGQTALLYNLALASPAQGSDANDKLIIQGAAGNESVSLGGSVVTFNGGDGNDFVVIGTDVKYGAGSVINGDAGSDTLSYRDSNVRIDGGAGNDTLLVAQAATINLNNAADQVTGGGITVNFEHISGLMSAGSLTVTGRNDVFSQISGGIAADTLNAGTAGAYLDGWTSTGDVLNGGAGADTLVFRGAGQTYSGGGGVDTLKFAAAGTFSGADFQTVTGMEKVVLAAGTNNLTIDAAFRAAMSGPNISLTGSSGSENIDIGAGPAWSGTITVLTGAGSDSLDLRSENTTGRFTGNLGADNDIVTLFGFYSGVAGAIDGGSGGTGGDTDTLQFDYRSGFNAVMADNLTGFERVELIDPTFNNVDIFDYSFTANDTAGLYVVAAANDRWTITLGDGGQTVFGAELNDIITGGAGADVINAGGGADQVFGGGGDDRIIIDADDGTVQGGEGYDTLVVRQGGAVFFGPDFAADSFERIDLTQAASASILMADSSLTLDVIASNLGETFNLAHGTIRASGGADTILITAATAGLGAFGEAGADKFDFSAVPAGNVATDYLSGTDKLLFNSPAFDGLSAATFQTQQAVHAGNQLNFNDDFLVFDAGMGLFNESEMSSYAAAHGGVDHAFAVNGLGDLFFIDGFAAHHLATGVQTATMADFQFYS